MGEGAVDRPCTVNMLGTDMKSDFVNIDLSGCGSHPMICLPGPATIVLDGV